MTMRTPAARSQAAMGESWHNLHHADPTCARHGVRLGQLDMTARLIWIFEKFGWAYDVRWPGTRRLARVTAVQWPYESPKERLEWRSSR